MRLPAALLTAGLVVALAGCSSAPAPENAEEVDAGSCERTPSGDLSDSISVTGDFGAKPQVDLESGLEAEETQRTVVLAGDGELAQEGDIVNVEFTILNGTTGEEIDATAYEEGAVGQQFDIDDTVVIPGIAHTLNCTTEGSRVVGVIPPAEAFGEAGSETLGLAGTDTLVAIIDVVSIVPPPLERAEGEPQPPVEGLPTVALDDTGRPTVTIPQTDPPAELEIAVLQQGDGEEVQPGATVTVHYQGSIWASGTIFDESWSRGTPAQFPTTGVIPGFAAALEGQNVGSQVLAVIPPDQGYGEGGNAEAGISGTDTLIFVVDILATTGGQ